MIIKRTFGLGQIIMAIFFLSLMYLASADGMKDSEESVKAVPKEQRLTEKELPPAVMSAFQNQYPDAQIKGLSKEVKDSTTYYEIESAEGKAKRSLLYTVDGKLSEVEEIITAKQLPDSIQVEIAKTYPKGKIEAAEKVTKNDTTTYEVKIENGEENLETVFDSNGKLINTEKAKKGEDND